MYRYYSIARPVTPGSYPRKVGIAIVNFGEAKFCEEINRNAWGYIEYTEALTDKEANEYELVSSEKKKFWCVTSVVYDDGRITAAITDMKTAARKPEDTEKSTPQKDIYINWFETEEEANEFVLEARNA